MLRTGVTTASEAGFWVDRRLTGHCLAAGRFPSIDSHPRPRYALTK